MSKIKYVCRIEFEITSPLSIGSGENQVTDKDIVQDSRGVPYIPGTSLAGIYRSLFDGKTANAYFGKELTKEDIRNTNGRVRLTESEVVTYDACMIDPASVYRVTKRDMVALDEYKTAIDGAKFDFQILEPGVRFVTYIEQNIDCEKKKYVLREIIDAWMKEKIQIGSKTGRGYGHTKGISYKTAWFDLGQEEDLQKWLDFNMYDEGDKNWGDTDKPVCLSHLTPSNDEYQKISVHYETHMISLKAEEQCNIVLKLQQQGGISIRQYSTEVGEADYQQLTISDGSKEGMPVIPGTSWAGAFRAQMGKLDPAFRKEQETAEMFFGAKKSKDKENRKSCIRFSESRIEGGKWVTYTRNAIDRFTGGTVDGALYTEKTYYNGNTELCIDCDFSGIEQESRNHFASVMAAAIMDLHGGYMAVGGLTAVGRGIFKITEIWIDGKRYLPEEYEMPKLYQGLAGAIAEKGGNINGVK